jgi:hypothetical protein
MSTNPWMKVITNGFRFRVGMSLAVGLIWASAAVGDDPLFPGAQYAAGTGPWSVGIGDLNGDQVPDLAVANYYTENVSVLLNQSPTPGDLDGDDDVDLLDFALFAGCMGGPGVTTPPPSCDPADFERADLQADDGDVDLHDCAFFQQRFRGSL